MKYVLICGGVGCVCVCVYDTVVYICVVCMELCGGVCVEGVCGGLCVTVCAHTHGRGVCGGMCTRTCTCFASQDFPTHLSSQSYDSLSHGDVG